jgi:hypothetical protein
MGDSNLSGSGLNAFAAVEFIKLGTEWLLFTNRQMALFDLGVFLF